MGAKPQSYTPSDDKKFLYTMQEIQATGESKLEHFGLGPSGTFPGNRMNYISHTDERNEFGRIISIYTKDSITELTGEMIYQFFDGIPIVRCKNILTNEGTEEIGLELATTFVQPGFASEENEELSLLIPHNGWQEEIQWKETPLKQLGLHIVADPGISSKRIQIRNIGSWSSGEYLPINDIKCEFNWDSTNGILTAKMTEEMARIIEIR